MVLRLVTNSGAEATQVGMVGERGPVVHGPSKVRWIGRWSEKEVGRVKEETLRLVW